MAGDVLLGTRKDISDNKTLIKNTNFDNRAYLKLLRFVILCLSSILAFSVRLFSILRYESVIHEFDPYFNYMTTKYLTERGFYSFLNWFDHQAWYPLGRIIGGTIYPGLMITSTVIYSVLQSLNITVTLRDVCVFIGPVFSSLTTILTYYLTSEVSNSIPAGLLSSAFISIVPGYISRSVAGSYDNESIAIFCMLLTYYLWLKSIKTGTVLWSVLCSLSYFYMVSSWGGYVFIINLIPLHVFVLILTGRFKPTIYISYSIFYVFGTLLSMQIPFVGFQPLTSSEHLSALCIFGLCQVLMFMRYLSSKMDTRSFEILFRSLFIYFILISAVLLIVLIFLGKISPFTGRLYSLLDPSYAKNYLPIIASVSEHQPTAWSSFYFDLQLLLFLFPVGLYSCFKHLTDENIFIILYGVTSLYFTSIMVRLMLILAPVMCILSGIGLSRLLSFYSQKHRYGDQKKPEKFKTKSTSSKPETARFFLLLSTCLLISYSIHCVWVTSEAYSSPSIVLSARTKTGNRLMFDDFREAYYWLRMNTPTNAKILSWWDYGYQISAMANRTTIVDNNTWNNTHIAIVGRAFASNEKDAYRIVQRLDVDYVLLLFGGLVGYSSDDLNKFLWMIRIAASTEHGKNIRERDYLSKDGEFRVDKGAPKKLTESLIYRLSYYQFGHVYSENREKLTGFDRVRQSEIGLKSIRLEHFEEAYTTEHWLVRIFRVKKRPNRA